MAAKLFPCPIIQVMCRSASCNPPCKRSHAVFYAWRDRVAALLRERSLVCGGGGSQVSESLRAGTMGGSEEWSEPHALP